MSVTSRRRVQLALLLGPASLFLLAFFAVPLGIMVVTSFLAPGLYGGVEWTFYPHSFGRILGFADPAFEDYDPIYVAIFLRSVKIAYANRDVALAQQIAQQDDEVDMLYARAFTQIMYQLAGSGSPEEADRLLGKPNTTLSEWSAKHRR